MNGGILSSAGVSSGRVCACNRIAPATPCLLLSNWNMDIVETGVGGVPMKVHRQSNWTLSIPGWWCRVGLGGGGVVPLEVF